MEDDRTKDKSRRFLHHVILPSLAPILFFIIASTPVEVLGCLTRGLLAVAVALIGAFAALGASIVGARAKSRGDTNYNWWLVSSLILFIPGVALIFLA